MVRQNLFYVDVIVLVGILLVGTGKGHGGQDEKTHDDSTLHFNCQSENNYLN